MHLPRPILFPVLLSLLLGACTGLGADAVRSTRTDYNQALRRTEDEQLLLNLVRLRYRDRVLFLEATALSSQFVFQGSAGASTTLVQDAGDERVLEGRLAFEERPTLSYRPLQGQDFVQRMMTRISLETLFLLDDSGWSTDRVFRTCVQQLNGLHNARRADGPTPGERPEFEDFARASQLLRQLELEGFLRGGLEPRGERGVIVLEPEALEREEYRQLVELLGLRPGVRTIQVVSTRGSSDEQSLHVHTRSLASVLYFLSHAVEVPEEDVAAGVVTVTRDDEGEVFDWHEVTRGLLRVHSSARRPGRAAVAVRHRGHWFYIDDADLDSKSTFSLLAQLFALQSGASQGLAPLLTLPLGG